MNIVETTENGITIFTLSGRIDSEGAVDLDLALHTAVSEGKFKMILDMAEVRYINSAGLRTLADILTTNRENGGELLLVSMNPKIKRVFEIIGFDQFFSSHESLADARAAIG
jgi:anti-sigma B factor antagonist